MSEFRLPDVGEGLTEAEIVTWRVSVGDEVSVNQPLVDIETAKSIVELPSPYAGTVTALLVPEGTTVPVGTPIIAVGEVGASASRRPSGTEAGVEAGVAETPAEPARQPVLVGYGPRATGAPVRRRANRHAAAPTLDPVMEPAPREPVVEPVPEPTARTLAKPPVRKLAKDLGVDLRRVPCPSGVVTRADVEAYAASLAPTSGSSSTPVAPSSDVDAGSTRRVPIKGVRKATAEAMVASAFTAPHVTEWVTVDVSATMELVERLRADRRFAEVKVSPTLLVARAAVLALRRAPELNATWDAPAQEIVLHGHVNLGVAAATDRGLVVPVVRGADRMSLVDLGHALGELTATARAGRTQPEQMSGGTFTLTNVGVFGVDAGTPILNPGQTGILCVGQVQRRPWVVGTGDDERIEPRWVTTLALSFDHRVVDGEQGSRFLADVAALLHDPALALTY